MNHVHTQRLPHLKVSVRAERFNLLVATIIYDGVSFKCEGKYVDDPGSIYFAILGLATAAHDMVVASSLPDVELKRSLGAVISCFGVWTKINDKGDQNGDLRV